MVAASPKTPGRSPRKPVKSPKKQGAGEIFEVEKLLDRRSAGKKGTYEYKIRWKGFSQKDDTWEHEDNILNNALIDEFNKGYVTPKKKSQSPKRSHTKKFVDEESEENDVVAKEVKSPGRRRAASPAKAKSPARSKKEPTTPAKKVTAPASRESPSFQSPAKSTRNARLRRNASPLRSLSKSPQKKVPEPPIPTSVKRVPVKKKVEQSVDEAPPKELKKKETPKKETPKKEANENEVATKESEAYVEPHQDQAKREHLWFEDLLLLLTVGSSVAHLWGVLRGEQKVADVTKAIPTASLVFLAGMWTASESFYSTCVIIGLLASMVGNVFSLWEEHQFSALIAFMFSFMIYTIAFLWTGAPFHAKRAIVFYALGAAFIVYGRIPMQGMWISITFVALLPTMVWRAASMIGHMDCYQDTAMFGTILLALAAMLQVRHWLPMVPISAINAQALSMTLYHWGQYLVAKSVVGAPA